MALEARRPAFAHTTWELDRPVFRVDLWRRFRVEQVPVERRPPGLRQEDMGWECSEWELSGGNVADVLAWADDQMSEWQIADVWVLIPDGGDGVTGRVRLRGHNPSDPRSRPS